MRIAFEITHEEINALGYPVVVERWKHISCGRGRRAFLAEFDEKERVRVRELYKIFYRWYLVTGAPEYHRIRPEKYQLMRRVCNFFASL